MPLLESTDERYKATLRLQKVYKSFRTRRQLADCAILVEQKWWKLLDFAELEHSSVSFFDIDKPETTASRWSRARTRAAKLGKGLSKDERARKLALQHWLEAIDPRHRYGHNLQFFYVKWLQCESYQPFFYWLDIGEGKEVNLDRCPRLKLQRQCIKYLGPMERMAYEIEIEDGKFFYKQTGTGIPLDTRGGPQDAKWIFVLSTSKTLCWAEAQRHVSTFKFLGWRRNLICREISCRRCILKAVWPHSGYYLPTKENFDEIMFFLKEHNVDLSIVQKSPTDEEEVSHGKKRHGIASQINLLESDFTQANEETNAKSSAQEKTNSRSEQCTDGEIKHQPSSRFMEDEQLPGAYLETPVEVYETAGEDLPDDDGDFSVPKQNLFDEDQEATYEEAIPKEKIIERINSLRRTKSHQLAHRLSCKWTTGAGPRIGCVRDYPIELQNRALEEVNLSPSPRSAFTSPRISTATSLCRETVAGSNPLAFEQKMVLHQIATP